MSGNRPTSLKIAAEACLLIAVVVVVASDRVVNDPRDRWAFAIVNVAIGLLGWFRPSAAGWLLLFLFGVVSLIALVGSSSIDAPLLVTGAVVAGPLVVGLLFVLAARVSHSDPGPSPEVAHKRAACYLGLHAWAPATTAGARYLRCKYCGKYGGTPPAPWQYRE